MELCRIGSPCDERARFRGTRQRSVNAAQKDPPISFSAFWKEEAETSLRTAPEGGQVQLVNEHAKKGKISQSIRRNPDGTQFGSMTKGSVLADETGKSTLKDIYNPTNQRSMPKLESFRSTSDRTATATASATKWSAAVSNPKPL